MKHLKKFIIMLAAFVATLALGIFAACGGGGGEKHPPHVDKDNDGLCDVCKEPMGQGGEKGDPLLTDCDGTGAIGDPYMAKEGRYRYSFPKNSPMYVNFYAEEEGVYSISSGGDVDAQVTRVFGNYNSGYYVPQNPTYEEHNDDISESDSNFYLEFNYEGIQFVPYDDKGNGEYLSYGNVVTFEVRLSEKSQTKKEFTIVFAYEHELEPEPDPVPVTVQAREITENPYPDEETGAEIRDALDAAKEMGFSSVSVVTSTDGYYHWDSQSGPILMVRIAVAFPKFGMDKDFWEVANPTDPMTGEPVKTPENVSMYEKNEEGYFYYDYYDFVKAYHDAANSDGLYPATEELVTFLKRYIAKPEVYAWVTQPEYAGFLPQGLEWIWACCFYDVDNSPTLTGKGTQEDPYRPNIMTDANKGQYYSFEITAARGTVYFLYGQSSSFTISSSTEGVAAIYNGTTYGADGNGFTFTTNNSSGTDELGAFQMRLLSGYTSREVRFTLTQEENGSEDIPYTIQLNTEYSGTMTFSAVYYTIVVTEPQTYVMKYTDGASAVILNYVYRPDYIRVDKFGPYGVNQVLDNGVNVPSETAPENAIVFKNLQPGTYIFNLRSYQSETYAFTMSLYYDEFETGEGTESSPYEVGVGNYRIEITNGAVYVLFKPTVAGQYTITVSSPNAKMTDYEEEVWNATDSGISYSLNVGSNAVTQGRTYLFIFDMQDGATGNYTVTISKA